MRRDIKLILGTMNFGPQVSEEDSLKMVKQFLASGNNEIDAAYVYNNGDTEKILGSVLKSLTTNITSIATKVHPRITGKLDGEAVNLQFSESLRRLGTDKVDILYFHFPDAVTPVEDALKTINTLYEDGKIKEFGLSNFPAWMVVDIWHICKKNGWLCPSVYQGRYNALSRNVEPELLPSLRQLNIRFYAYNPLAGGMLTGKHLNYEEQPQQGRFARLPSYQKRYWKKSYFDAVNIVTAKCREYNIEPVEAAYRWLVNHSLLDCGKKDGIIIGASSMKQLEQNMATIQKGNLPQQIVDALDIAWSEAKCESPEYFEYF
ncbi:MAG TPA: aldo/keto reductase [Bacteroidia bacterium]|nr:aldo/keto reductase [Bacteroidia bacterium]